MVLLNIYKDMSSKFQYPKQNAPLFCYLLLYYNKVAPKTMQRVLFLKVYLLSRMFLIVQSMYMSNHLVG